MKRSTIRSACSLSLLTFALGAAPAPMRVGPAPGGGTIVATGQVLRPAGETVAFAGRPVDLALAPDGRTLYVKDDRGIVVLSVEPWRLRQELTLPQSGSSMHGIAVTRDGARVFVTTTQNLLCEAAVQSDGRLAWKRRIALPGPQAQGPAYPCGVALSADGKIAYVALSRNNSLAVVDLVAGRFRREIPVGIAPFGVALAPDGRRAYVSNWGGRHPKPDERTAPSSGTAARIDARGVAASGTVSVVDLAQEREIVQIETGLHPSGLALDAGSRRLYVACSNSDTVSAIDTASNRVVGTVSVRPDPALPFGSMPNALALGAGGRTLYVANGGNNAVAVVGLPGKSGGAPVVRGFVPAGWFPGALATDGKRLFVANVKGLGSRRRQTGQKGWRVQQFLGTVNRVALAQPAELARWSRQVRADARVPQMLRAWERKQSGRAPVPVPARTGEPSVFEHVVYVIKENRTYDQLFGDLPRGNNDSTLCLFGREVTPNHHALAEQFALLDNYYCNGVNSADGHAWSTEGNVTDYLEKAFGGFTRSYTFGDDPLSYSASGFLWDHALLAGLSFRNYGEMDYAEPVPRGTTFSAIYRDFVEQTERIRFTQNIGIETLRRYSSPTFPGWNLRIPDVLRAEMFLRELRQAEQQGTWPNLQIVYLPCDHTSGTQPGAPTPRAQVADNDLALGRVVEGITKSKFWPKTCIFVIEDDPQDGFDHVDGHRSICLVISPYTRRGAVISEFYNQTSVLHTMERILGIPPMNQMDAMAPLMTACFSEKPDYQSFSALPNRVPLDELNPPLRALGGKVLHWAEQSARLSLEKADQADEDLLNRILWHAIRGVDAPYPAHLAGPHSRGLKALHLGHTEEGRRESDQ